MNVFHELDFTKDVRILSLFSQAFLFRGVMNVVRLLREANESPKPAHHRRNTDPQYSFLSLEKSLTTIEVYQCIIQSLEECIEQHNNP